MSLALYYYQGEHLESLDCPNAFAIPSSSISYGQFLENFPLPHHSLQFRFQTEDSDYDYLWTDVTSHAEILPVYKGKVSAKILRLDDISASKRKTKLRLKMQANKSNVFSGNNNVPTHKPQNAPPAMAPTKVLPPKVDPPKPSAPAPVKATPSRPTPVPAAAVSIDDPVILQTITPPAAAPAPVTATPAAPAAVYAPHPNNNNYSTSATDIDDDEPPAPATTSAASDPFNLASPLVPVPDDAGPGKAVATKSPQEKEEEETEIAKKKWNDKLTSWYMENNKKRNIRTLLTTMHTVLWSGNRWKTLGLSDVIDPKKVKLYYRKAMLVVHPDHCNSADDTAEKRYIARQIFEAVKDAYKEFETKECVN